MTKPHSQQLKSKAQKICAAPGEKGVERPLGLCLRAPLVSFSTRASRPAGLEDHSYVSYAGQTDSRSLQNVLHRKPAFPANVFICVCMYIYVCMYCFFKLSVVVYDF